MREGVASHPRIYAPNLTDERHLCGVRGVFEEESRDGHARRQSRHSPDHGSPCSTEVTWLSPRLLWKGRPTRTAITQQQPPRPLP